MIRNFDSFVNEEFGRHQSSGAWCVVVLDEDGREPQVFGPFADIESAEEERDSLIGRHGLDEAFVHLIEMSL